MGSAATARRGARPCFPRRVYGLSESDISGVSYRFLMYSPGLCLRDYASESICPPRSWRIATARLTIPFCVPTTRSSGCFPWGSSPGRSEKPPAILRSGSGRSPSATTSWEPKGLATAATRTPVPLPCSPPSEQRELSEALKEPPPDGGMWNSRKVAEWIEHKTGRRGLRAQRGWEYLRKLGHTPQVPRPSNAEASPSEQEAFKKSSPSA